MSIDALSTALAYRFGDPALLEQALTHRSYSGNNNERLEFLGDALIGAVMADALYHARRTAEEGALSRLRASLVREETLAAIARRLRLGDLLKLGEGELKSGGWRRDSVLADALEAVIGAIYLDGGYVAMRQCCLHLFAPELGHMPDAESLKDAKTRLQEWLQGRSRPLPNYEMLSESGPAHRRHFEVRVRLIDEDRACEAAAGNRRLAEQRAAEKMLASLGDSAQAAGPPDPAMPVPPDHSESAPHA